MLRQYCLEGILVKESSVTTIDFLLCRDLLLETETDSDREQTLEDFIFIVAHDWLP